MSNCLACVLHRCSAFLLRPTLSLRASPRQQLLLGCKERSAHAVGWKWFNKPEIRTDPSRLASTLDRYAVAGRRIIRDLALIAFGNIGDFITVEEGGGAIVDFGTATREQMPSLKSVEIDVRSIDGVAPGVRKIKIRMSDKRQALMDLAKMACCRLITSSIAVRSNVTSEHKIDIKSMDHDEREQLRRLC